MPVDPVDPEPFWREQIRVVAFYAIWAAARGAASFWTFAAWVGAPRAWNWFRSKLRR